MCTQLIKASRCGVNFSVSGMERRERGRKKKSPNKIYSCFIPPLLPPPRMTHCAKCKVTRNDFPQTSLRAQYYHMKNKHTHPKERLTNRVRGRGRNKHYEFEISRRKLFCAKVTYAYIWLFLTTLYKAHWEKADISFYKSKRLSIIVILRGVKNRVYENGACNAIMNYKLFACFPSRNLHFHSIIKHRERERKKRRKDTALPALHNWSTTM